MTSPRRRLAVVLFNLGGPDGPKAVQPFLFNLFSDPAIITSPVVVRLPLAALISTTRRKSAQASYDRMGGRSPILPETERQAEALDAALAQALPGVEAKTFIAMRYWKPFTGDAARQVEAFAPDGIVLLPLYPQFSTTTTASSLKAWRQAYRGSAPTRAVCCYPTAEGLIEAHARMIETAWEAADKPEPMRLLFSAHGLPEKIVADGDPYQSQIEAGAAAIAAKLSTKWDWARDWQVCYQSRVGPLKWLGPSTAEAIDKAAHDGVGVVVCPIAFVSEHVETLVELDHDYAILAQSLGCAPYVRVPALGIEPGLIDTLVKVTRDALDREPDVESACGGRWCAAEFSGCPAKGASGGQVL
jgi:ferrochelatase